MALEILAVAAGDFDIEAERRLRLSVQQRHDGSAVPCAHVVRVLLGRLAIEPRGLEPIALGQHGIRPLDERRRRSAAAARKSDREQYEADGPDAHGPASARRRTGPAATIQFSHARPPTGPTHAGGYSQAERPPRPTGEGTLASHRPMRARS